MILLDPPIYVRLSSILLSTSNMAGWTFLALLVICAIGGGNGGSSSTPRSTTSTTSSKSTTSSYSSRYFYMDDSTNCGYVTIARTRYLSYFSQDAYVKAWGRTYPHNPPSFGCTATFSSYSTYGLKYSFSSLDYINDCGITLKIYEDSDAYGIPTVSDSCHDRAIAAMKLQKFSVFVANVMLFGIV